MVCWRNKQDPTTGGFEFFADSDEAIDRSIDFELAQYALVSAVEMKFPAGDTYKFDLELNDDKAKGEILKTVVVRMKCLDVPVVALVDRQHMSWDRVRRVELLHYSAATFEGN